MLRSHLLQNWFSLSDPSMEEALYEITPMRQFARLTLSAPIPEPDAAGQAPARTGLWLHLVRMGWR
jgi:IS5 family transposase